MGKVKYLLLGLFMVLVSVITPQQTHAQADIVAIIKEGIKKVIKAVDLQIQRFQTETIWLQNAQKTLENTMSKLKLDDISDWVERQRKLYADYFDELWKVKEVITYYHRVKDIIEKQGQLLEQYKKAYALVQQDPNFTPKEVEYMYEVYSGIIDESIKNLDQVYLVINAFSTQMTDAKRVEIINTAADNIEHNIADLQQFNTQNMMISLQRAKEKNEIDLVKKLYGF